MSWTEHLVWALPAKGERLYHEEMGPLSEKDALALAPRMADIFLKNIASLTIVPLATMKALKRIYVAGDVVKLRDLDGIQCCKSLENVDVSRHAIDDVIPLGDLPRLVYVCLNGNRKLRDLLPLASCKNLELVRIDDTAVRNLLPLAHLPKLKQIAVKTTFPQKARAAFLAKRPDVKL